MNMLLKKKGRDEGVGGGRGGTDRDRHRAKAVTTDDKTRVTHMDTIHHWC